MIFMEIYDEDLAHEIMEANGSVELLPASWRCWEASDALWSESEGLRIGKGDGINPSPRAGKIPHLRQAGRTQRSEFLLPVSFALFRPSVDRMKPFSSGENSPLH